MHRNISANGVWGGRLEKTYFDVRVFNPLAPSNKNTTLSACFKKHEREKKRAYERVREVEHSSFTPLVMAATGGLGNEATTFYKRLASVLSQKWAPHYVGYDAVWPSLSYAAAFRPSEVPDLLKEDLHVQ